MISAQRVASGVLALGFGFALLSGAQETDSAIVGASLEDTGSELVITTQPMQLPAMADADHHSHAGIFPPVVTLEIPAHGYLRGFDYEIIDGDGNILPRQILHHFNIIDPDHRELFLPISQRLLAAGQETGAQSMPRLLFGVPVYVGQRIVLATMLHNPTGVEQHDVSLRIKLKYTKVGRPWPLFEVYPFQIDVAFPAGDKSFDLPPGESEMSWEGSPFQEGRVMVVGSHLHELATEISWEDMTTGEVLWTGYPVEKEDGTLEGVTIGKLYRKLGVKIYPDHVYRVTVRYDNTTGEVVPDGGMGVVAGVFMPSSSGAWPRADVQDPLYALDRMHYMREVRGKYETIVAGETTPADEHAHDEAGTDHSSH